MGFKKFIKKTSKKVRKTAKKTVRKTGKVARKTGRTVRKTATVSGRVVGKTVEVTGKVAIKAATRPDKVVKHSVKGAIRGTKKVTKGTYKTAKNTGKLGKELGKYSIGRGDRKKLVKTAKQTGRSLGGVGIDAAITILGAGTGGLLPNLVMDAVEEKTKSRKGITKFTIPARTLSLFNQFVRNNKKFPYKNTYGQIKVWYHASPPADGITFENRIFLKKNTVPNVKKIQDVKLLFHEYVHTFQYKKHGLKTFSEIYSANYLKNFLKGKFGDKNYRSLKFEKEAYGWADVFETWVKTNSLL